MAGGNQCALVAANPAGASLQAQDLSSKHCTSLIKGLTALRSAEKLFDVTLIAEGKEFKAHRVVLAACSDYFCAMFTDSMREATQPVITLNGLTARGAELIIEYIYTAHLELNLNNVEDVLSAATHVQVPEAIDACAQYLESLVDLENCVAIVTLADLYALDDVKHKTYLYLCAHMRKFSQLPDFYQLSWQQLEHMLDSNYPVDCTELHLLEITIQYCLKLQLKPELAQLLFRCVRLHTIPVTTLYVLLEAKLPEQSAYKQLVEQELEAQNYAQKNEFVMLGRRTAEEIPCVTVLSNTRGMELALIKIGGFETDGLTNQLSSYLPSKGKWEKLTVIPHIEQCNYGTAVLGNDLYIVGGSYDVCLKEYIHPFGFRYDPIKNIWNSIKPIQADRCRFSLNAMGTYTLYAVGGVCEDIEMESEYRPREIPPSNCERYSAKTDTWEYIAPLRENRSQHAGVTVENKLYISGGIDRHIIYNTLWCFDSETQAWSELARMPTPRADHVMIAFDDNIYVCGGWYEDPDMETRILAETIDVYNIASNKWSTVTRNPMPRFYTGVAALKRSIYFIGGLYSSSTINRASSAAQRYDIDTKTWTMDANWDYTSEVWECTCAAFYVPRDRDYSQSRQYLPNEG